MTKATPNRGKKKTTTVVEEPIDVNDVNDGPTELDVNLEAVEDTETLQTVLESFGETSVLLKVYRETTQGQEFCYPCQPPLDEEFIQRNYGGGNFAIRIFIADRYRKTLKIKIAQKLQSANGSPSVDSQTDFLQKMILVMLQNNHAPAAQQPFTLPDIVNTLAAIDNMRGKQESGMDLFLKGASFAKDMGSDGGSGDWKDRLWGIADKVAPALAPALTNFFGNRGTPPGQPPVVAGQPPQPPDPQQEQMVQQQQLIQGIAFLKQQFIAGLDPESAINWVVTNAAINPQYQNIIRTVCNLEYAELAKLDPEIGTEPFFTPFHAFYDGLRSEFATSDPVDDDPGGISGDTGDTGNHGAVGKGRNSSRNGA
jgi:hypothetical protein